MIFFQYDDNDKLFDQSARAYTSYRIVIVVQCDLALNRRFVHIYMVYKKTEQIWNCSQFRKTAISIQFFMYIAYLGTYNIE
jgi:hypothetical protein